MNEWLSKYLQFFINLFNLLDFSNFSVCKRTQKLSACFSGFNLCDANINMGKTTFSRIVQQISLRFNHLNL